MYSFGLYLQCQLLFLDQDPEGVLIESGGELQHLIRHGGGQQDNHGLLVEIPELNTL